MGGAMGQPSGMGGGLGAINFAPLRQTLPTNRGPYPIPMSTTPGGLGAINFAPSQITVPTTPPNIESRQRQILPPPGYQIPTTTPPGIPPAVWGELEPLRRTPPPPTGLPAYPGRTTAGSYTPIPWSAPVNQGWTGSTQLISPTSTAPSAFGGMPRIQNPWARLLTGFGGAPGGMGGGLGATNFMLPVEAYPGSPLTSIPITTGIVGSPIPMRSAPTTPGLGRMSNVANPWARLLSRVG